MFYKLPNFPYLSPTRWSGGPKGGGAPKSIIVVRGGTPQAHDAASRARRSKSRRPLRVAMGHTTNALRSRNSASLAPDPASGRQKRLDDGGICRIRLEGRLPWLNPGYNQLTRQPRSTGPLTQRLPPAHFLHPCLTGPLSAPLGESVVAMAVSAHVAASAVWAGGMVCSQFPGMAWATRRTRVVPS